ncbi:hypothetical protein Agabi119p4_2942 [Agaricus bisporus var. burnettii]|uniref:Mitochondrial outer membrane transport complex Sam37/metaxin N-terminal domain-containing protein n=1 Tax=Agaricus bisporus var. burnettii TaxID=192524 RepID=A0A8H7KIP7_AGABI|nr:hypothetical protein Agabi119p4_2942 [Agaricus bisporus var. burnettii]
MAIPGQFNVAECNNPDISPSGQLPFLVHEQHSISSFSSIVKYIVGLKKEHPDCDLDAPLAPSEWSQRNAWTSHIESHFGNLVYHSCYSNADNWEKVIHPALVSMYGVPQQYYVPERIRASYKPRLEAAGLWSMPPPPKPVKKSFSTEKRADANQEAKGAFTQAFEKEKIQDKAKHILGLYARLLEGKQFIYQGRPTTLDLMLAAHTLLLISPPFPDTLIKELVTDWYDTIAEHAKRIQDIAFSSDRPKFLVSASRGTVWGLLPSWRLIRGARGKVPKRTQEDIQYERFSWGFIGLALGSAAAYFAIMGSPIRLSIRTAEELDEEEEYEEEDDEDEFEEPGESWHDDHDE